MEENKKQGQDASFKATGDNHLEGRMMKFTDKEWPDNSGSTYEKLYTYSYYLFASIPIRLLSMPNQKWCRSEILNYRTGKFEYNYRYAELIKDDEAGEAQEISKEEFYKECEEYMAYHTPERIAELDLLQKKNMKWLQEQLDNKKAGV